MNKVSLFFKFITYYVKKNGFVTLGLSYFLSNKFSFPKESKKKHPFHLQFFEKGLTQYLPGNQQIMKTAT